MISVVPVLLARSVIGGVNLTSRRPMKRIMIARVGKMRKYAIHLSLELDIVNVEAEDEEFAMDLAREIIDDDPLAYITVADITEED